MLTPRCRTSSAHHQSPNLGRKEEEKGTENRREIFDLFTNSSYQNLLLPIVFLFLLKVSLLIYVRTSYPRETFIFLPNDLNTSFSSVCFFM
jgi:hypothetical protein